MGHNGFVGPGDATMRLTTVPRPLFLFLVNLPVFTAASQVLLRIPEDDALMAALTILGVLAPFSLYYYETDWWDKLMHVLTTVIIAAIVVMALMVVETYSKSIRVPSRWTPFFVFILVMMVGVTWEVFEFLIDKTFGTNMQHSLQDTTVDLATDLVGALIGALTGAIYLMRHTYQEFVDRLGIEMTAKRVDEFLLR